MRLRIFAVLVPLLILITGCQPPATLVGGKPRAKIYQRIVSLSPSVSELIGNFGSVQFLKGRTSECNYPANLANVEVVQTGTKPDYEKVTATVPDLIIYDKSLYGPADVEKIKSLNVKTLEMDVHTLSEYETFLAKLAETIGGETSISEYVDKVDAERDAAKGAMAGKHVKALVLMASPGAEYMAAGTKSFLADVIRSAGGEPVGPDAGNWVTLNPEEIIKEDPAIIFLPDHGQSQILADPRLSSVKAVKNKEVYELKGDYLLRAGARVDALIKALSSQMLRAKV